MYYSIGFLVKTGPKRPGASFCACKIIAPQGGFTRFGTVIPVPGTYPWYILLLINYEYTWYVGSGMKYARKYLKRAVCITIPGAMFLVPV